MFILMAMNQVLINRVISLDQAVLEYHWMLELAPAPQKHIESVRNWVNGKKPLIRSESTVFLETSEQEDFVALKGSQANDTGIIENLLEIAIKRCPRKWSQVKL